MPWFMGSTNPCFGVNGGHEGLRGMEAFGSRRGAEAMPVPGMRDLLAASYL